MFSTSYIKFDLFDQHICQNKKDKYTQIRTSILLNIQLNEFASFVFIICRQQPSPIISDLIEKRSYKNFFLSHCNRRGELKT